MTDTNSITPCGYVRTQGEKYFLINPCPDNPEWKGDEGKSFLVVPDDRDKGGESINIGTEDEPIFKHVFPCQRLIVTNNYSVEYGVSILPILCRLEISMQDKSFEDFVDTNKEGALS